MAIRTETYELNGRLYVRTWSNEHRYIVGGEPLDFYSEANDPAEYNRQYEEGEVMPSEEWIIDQNEATAEDYENALADLGVRV